MRLGSNIVLIGFSGTGKSRVGLAVARILGWQLIDIDEEVIRRSGNSIATIFQEEGEESFREQEGALIREACGGDQQVVVTGGGAFAIPENRRLMLRSGVVVCLEARPETIQSRLEEQANGFQGQSARPLLISEHPLDRIKALKGQRQVAYAEAHWTVHTDGFSVEQVAQEVVRASRMVKGQDEPDALAAFHGDPFLAAKVQASSGSYPILVGWGLLPKLGDLLGKAGVTGPVYLVTDNRVFDNYGRVAQYALHHAGLGADTFIIPNGEESKTLDMAQRLYGWLAERRAERSHSLVALGGGVVGDLTGYVAATYNRGMGFIQVPTSLAAMVDASIGGKTAVNLPQAKNLVGSFYQPCLVVADVSLLQTLSKKETVEGWAEAIKHGLILDASLFETFERHTNAILALEPQITTDTIRRSVAIKARVVSEDERETTGYRTLLNYGHTIGHGLETATEYGRFLHGEAVSVGMIGAARIGHELGITPQRTVKRQQEVLRSFDLPQHCAGVELERIMAAMALDKKMQGKTVRWVLLEEIGNAVVRNDVPDALVQRVLRELSGQTV